MVEKVISFIHKINEQIGKAASWFTTALVLLIVVDVIFRYFFKDTAAWIIELEWHFFAIIFLLGGGYALRHDKHVRVDLFYSNFSKRDQAWVNLVGATLLLLPWCIAIIWFSAKYAFLSIQIQEGSPDPGGLPARYIIKFVIVIGFILLMLQAFGIILQSVLTLRSPKKI